MRLTSDPIHRFLLAFAAAMSLTVLVSPAASAAPPSASPAAVSCSSGRTLDFNYAGFSIDSNLGNVSVELNYSGTVNGLLRVRRQNVAPGPWEKFTICHYDSPSNYWTIKSDANGKYVSVELSSSIYPGKYSKILRARADTVGAWEMFDFQPFADPLGTMWRILSLADNLFVATEVGGDYTGYVPDISGVLRARTSAPGIWERVYMK